MSGNCSGDLNLLTVAQLPRQQPKQGAAIMVMGGSRTIRALLPIFLLLVVVIAMMLEVPNQERRVTPERPRPDRWTTDRD